MPSPPRSRSSQASASAKLGVGGAAAAVGGDPVGARVGAQEPHLGADPAQRPQRLPDPGVGDVALGVEGEAVPARARRRWAGSPAGSGSPRGPRTRSASPAARPGGRRPRTPPASSGRRRSEPAAGCPGGRPARTGSARPRCRCSPSATPAAGRCRRRAARPRRRRRCRRATAWAPAAVDAAGRYSACGSTASSQRRTWAWACGWVPTDRTSASVRPGPGDQRERDRQHHLAGDHQRVAGGELVEGGGDGALDGVLQRHHRGVGLAGCGPRPARPAPRRRAAARPGRGGDAAQRLLGEGARRTEVGVAGGRDPGHGGGPTPRASRGGGRHRGGRPGRGRAAWCRPPTAMPMASDSSGESAVSLTPPAMPLA